MKASGVTQSQMDKPFIGIVTSFTDLIPGHAGMRDLERFIEKGVHSGGGQAFFFGVPGVCDGIVMGHKGMHYSLPTRELIADMIESVAEGHRLDGLVLLTNCDKITPGMLMAAARLDIPCIVVTAGPMMTGRGHNGRRYSLISDTFEALARYKAGTIDEKELMACEENACPRYRFLPGNVYSKHHGCAHRDIGYEFAWLRYSPGCFRPEKEDCFYVR
jgi:dihydroxy-acid dehydratase